MKNCYLKRSLPSPCWTRTARTRFRLTACRQLSNFWRRRTKKCSRSLWRKTSIYRLRRCSTRRKLETTTIWTSWTGVAEGLFLLAWTIRSISILLLASGSLFRSRMTSMFARFPSTPRATTWPSVFLKEKLRFTISSVKFWWELWEDIQIGFLPLPSPMGCSSLDQKILRLSAMTWGPHKTYRWNSRATGVRFAAWSTMPAVLLLEVTITRL